MLDGLKDKRAKDVYMLRYFSSAGEKMTWKKYILDRKDLFEKIMYLGQDCGDNREFF